MKIFVLDVDREKEYVRIFGRNENGEKVCLLIEYPFYVYVLPKEGKESDVMNLLKEKPYVKRIEVVEKKYLGKKYNAIKTYLNFADLDKLKEDVKQWKELGLVEGKKESDIPPHKKFMIDEKVFPLHWYEFEGKKISMNYSANVYKVEPDSLKEISLPAPKLRILALDIETLSFNALSDPKKDPIISIALYGENFEKVITWKGEFKDDKFVKVKNEYELLKKFGEMVKEYDPDVIVGYNSNDFDLNYIYERAKTLNLTLELGWDKSFVQMTRKRDRRRFKIVGTQHVDLYEFIINIFSSQMESETFTLDEVAREVLGEGKLELSWKDMYEIWTQENNIEKLLKYNLRDAELTYMLYKHFENILYEISRIVGQTIHDVSHMTYGQLVEWYFIKRSRDFDEIVPNKPKPEDVEKRKAVTYKGAFVLEPKPGLYENIVVLDFRSLYPSIIIRYNISFDTLKCEHEECKEKNSIEIETSLGKSIVWFCIKRKGFIPTILSEIFEERALLKKKLKTSDENSEEYRVLYAKQYALKILANATYGYLGFPNSRWYSLECAAAITALGRKSIHFVLEEAQKKGLKPIYGDTDSVFLLYPSKETVYEFLDEINNKLGKPMELELEDFYLRGIFVPKREEKEGAKKKYALLSESGKIKLRGFETVRRDWAPIAKEVQENVINMILRENDKNKVLNYVREIIQKIKKKELPLEKFILREQLRKDLSEYKAEGPHVYAAKKYKQKGYDIRAGFIVEYIISSGGEKIRDKVKLPEECKKNDYDPEYYIDRQVIPAIERILNAIGITKEQVVGEQRSILSFFKK